MTQMGPKQDLNSVDFVRRHYKVPATMGGRVRYTGVRSGQTREGTITGAMNGYLLVKMDGATTSIPYHPTQNLEYMEPPAGEPAGPIAASGCSTISAGSSLLNAQRSLSGLARPMLELTAMELAAQLGILIAKLAEHPSQALRIAREISEQWTDQEAPHYHPAQDVARSLAAQARSVQKKRRDAQPRRIIGNGPGAELARLQRGGGQ